MKQNRVDAADRGLYTRTNGVTDVTDLEQLLTLYDSVVVDVGLGKMFLG